MSRDIAWVVKQLLPTGLARATLEETVSKVTEQLEDIFNDRAGHLPPRLVTTNLGPPGRCPRIQARINRLAAVVVLG